MDARLVVGLLAYLVAFLAMTWAFSLDADSGQWQSFLAIPAWVAMVVIAVFLAVTKQVPLSVALPLFAFAAVAPRPARVIAPLLQPLARQWHAAAARDRRAASTELIADHRALLEAAFREPRRVEQVESIFLRLEGGYPLRLEVSVPGEQRAAFEAAARAALVGRRVAVILAPGFHLAYAGRSGVTDRWRRQGGEGAGFLDVPAAVSLDGLVLRGWRDGALWWEPAQPPRR